MSAAVLRVSADRRVRGTIPASRLGDQHPPRLGVLLDGTMIGTIALEPGENAAEWVLSLPLPGHRLGALLDLLRLDTGESVLPAPFPLAGLYRFFWHGAVRRGRVIDGAFSLGVTLDPALYVALGAEGVVHARGFAHRDAAGLYRFSLALTRLVPLGPPTRLVLAIAGVEGLATVSVGTADLGLAGYVEAADAGEIRGWAADLGDPGRALSVVLRENGEEIASTRADGARPDLAAAGINDGRAGFRLPYAPRRLPPGTPPPELRIEIAEFGLALVGSPIKAPTLPGFAGHFDGIENAVAAGWALSLVDPATALAVEIVQNGRVIAAGLPRSACGFRLTLPLNQAALAEAPFIARIADTDLVLEGSPRLARRNPAITAFLAAGERPLAAPLAARFKSRRARRIAGLMLSLILPVFNPREAWLKEALASVRAQRCDAFELICIDDGSTDPAIIALLRGTAAADARVRVLRSRRNEGVARAMARGIAAARGTHIAFLDHDDALAPDAVFQLLLAARESGADLIFADAAFAGENLDEIEHVALGEAFSHDAFLASAVLPRPLAIARGLATPATPEAALEGAEELDFVLRAIANAAAIAHVPRVLYRARRHGVGRAAVLDPSRVGEARARAVKRHLAALGLPARVLPGLAEGQRLLAWPAAAGEVAVVLGHDQEKRNQGGRGRAAAFRAAGDLRCRIVSRPPAGPGPGFILFLDQEIALPDDGAWLAHLCALAARPDIAAVAPLLLTPAGQVREMGLVLGGEAVALPALAGDEAFLPGGEAGPIRNPGPGGRLTVVRDVSALSAAALVTRRDVFAALGGFARALGPLAAADFALRARARGLRVLVSGVHPLYHRGPPPAPLAHDLKARFRARWPDIAAAGDPFYSPLCTPERADFALRPEEASCRKPARARIVPGPGVDHE